MYGGKENLGTKYMTNGTVQVFFVLMKLDTIYLETFTGSVAQR